MVDARPDFWELERVLDRADDEWRAWARLSPEERIRWLWKTQRQRILNGLAAGGQFRSMPPQPLGQPLRPGQPLPTKPTTPLTWIAIPIGAGQHEIQCDGVILERGRFWH